MTGCAKVVLAGTGVNAGAVESVRREREEDDSEHSLYMFVLSITC